MDEPLMSAIERLNETVSDLSVAALENDRSRTTKETKLLLELVSKLLVLLESTED